MRFFVFFFVVVVVFLLLKESCSIFSFFVSFSLLTFEGILHFFFLLVIILFFLLFFATKINFINKLVKKIKDSKNEERKQIETSHFIVVLQLNIPFLLGIKSEKMTG